MAPRLPIVGGDFNGWGDLLNYWLGYDHDSTGSHRPRVPDSSNPIDNSVSEGDFVYWDTTSSSYKPALAGSANPQQASPIGMMSHIDPSPTIVLFGVADTTATLVPGTIYYLSDTTAGRVVSSPPGTAIKVGTAITTKKLVLNIDGVRGATQALDNLSSVAINTSLLPATDNTIDVGSGTKRLRALYAEGISSTSVQSKNLAGTVTLSAGTFVVAFGTAEPDTNYTIGLSWNTNEVIWWTSKTTSGFTLLSSNGSSSAVVDWHLLR